MSFSTYVSQSDMASLEDIFRKHLVQPSLSGLGSLSSETKTIPIGNILTLMASEPSEINWNRLHYAVQNFFVTGGEDAPVSRLPGLRVILTSPDGRVVYDSSKDNNSWLSFITDTINENQNTRSAFLQAVLGNSGYGYEVRYTIENNSLLKKAFFVNRIGSSSSDVLGCICLAVNTK